MRAWTATREELRSYNQCNLFSRFNSRQLRGADVAKPHGRAGAGLRSSLQRIVDAPGGIRRAELYASGYSVGTSHRSSEVRQYCDVTGYVAPQNKFELRFPLARDWNGNFFFNACAGSVARFLLGHCDFGLMRGYASATENGGHERASGFNSILAANAPELQEDFGWRSNPS